MTYFEMATPEEPEEWWLPVVGFEGVYEVSNLGRIKRILAINNTWSGRILKDSVDRKGYHYRAFCKNGTEKADKLHRVVAKAFIANPLNLPEVNHKDGNKGNNRASNLEWTTNLDNVQHAKNLGLRATCERHPLRKLTWEKVREIRKRYIKGDSINGARALAKEFGINGRSMTCVVKNIHWKE